MTTPKNNKDNPSLPIFLDHSDLRVLAIGHGTTSDEWEELLGFIPENGQIRIVDPLFHPATIGSFSSAEIILSHFEPQHLEGIQIVFSLLDDEEQNRLISNESRKKNLLVYIERSRGLSNFDRALTVGQGRLKVGIQRGEQASLLAENIRELFEKKFPGELSEVLESLRLPQEKPGAYDPNAQRREAQQKEVEGKLKRRIRRVMIYSFVVIASMIAGHLILSQIPTINGRELWVNFTGSLDENFHYYFFAGILAQMIDGALGMAYGVSVTTFLLSLGIPGITPAVASASMHASEIFTTGASSLVYMRYKNINKKLFRSLLIPGIAGAILGSVTISYFSKENVAVIRPFVALYTMFLGVLIILKAVNYRQKKNRKYTDFRPIAALGGFLDSLGGGGWGPIVTGTLIAGGRNLRYAIGSSHITKFFVAIISTITFIFLIGINHWQIIFGLILGGMIAAPLSIYLSTKIPPRQGLMIVGIFVILLSLRTMILPFFK